MKAEHERHNCRCHHCQLRHNRKSPQDIQNQLERKLENVFYKIEQQIDNALLELNEFLVIKSVSANFENYGETLRALDLMAQKLERLNFRVTEWPIIESAPSGMQVPEQKVLFASYFSSPTKSTLLIHAFLDVLPAEQNDGWFQEPFQLKKSDGILYGRGISAGKGPAQCWLQALRLWLEENEDLPVNIKFIVEALHEVGSTGLPTIIEAHPEFFEDVDCMVFSFNSWLNDARPVICCSLSGWLHFGIQVTGGNKTLDSGLAGGLVYEPMADLCHLMDSLLDDKQQMKIPYMQHYVQQLTVDEWDMLESADYSEMLYTYKDKFEVRRLKHELTKSDMLHHIWCTSTLTMHGVEGAFSDSGSQCVIPMTVMGKFSIRLLPNQTVKHITDTIEDYLNKQFEDLKMRTVMRIQLLDSCEPYAWSPATKYNNAAISALQTAFQMEPGITCGIPAALPIASVFHDLTHKNIIMLPFTKRMDRRIQINESISEMHYICNTKTCAALLYEVALLPTRCKCNIIDEYCNRTGEAERLAVLYKGPTQPTAPQTSSMIRRTLGTVQHKLKPKRERIRIEDEQVEVEKKSIQHYLCWPLKCKKRKKEKKKEQKGSVLDVMEDI